MGLLEDAGSQPFLIVVAFKCTCHPPEHKRIRVGFSMFLQVAVARMLQMAFAHTERCVVLCSRRVGVSDGGSVRVVLLRWCSVEVLLSLEAFLGHSCKTAVRPPCCVPWPLTEVAADLERFDSDRGLWSKIRLHLQQYRQGCPRPFAKRPQMLGDSDVLGRSRSGAFF